MSHLRQALTALAEWDCQPGVTKENVKALIEAGFMVEHVKGWSLTKSGRYELRKMRTMVSMDRKLDYIDEKVSAGELF